jgi:succinate-semialdehyde dehydrogenase/glutarate-semialdehyde dehydrogenase
MAVAGRFNNNGQSCIASKRFIAVAAVADEFWKSFKIASQLAINGSKHRLPLSSEEALIDILDQVERFEKAGAKILVGGKERLILVPLCNLPID